MYEYRAEVLRVVDADTLHLRLDLGVESERKLTVRLLGVNAPKTQTPAGKQADEFARRWLRNNAADGQIMVRTVKDRREKYGRYLVELWVDGVAGTLNQALLAAGHAVPYDGHGPRT